MTSPNRTATARYDEALTGGTVTEYHRSGVHDESTKSGTYDESLTRRRGSLDGLQHQAVRPPPLFVVVLKDNFGEEDEAVVDLTTATARCSTCDGATGGTVPP